VNRRLQTTVRFALVTLTLSSFPCFGQSVKIGVLGLFHPGEITLRASGGGALVIHAGGRALALERSSGIDTIRMRLSGDAILVEAASVIERAQIVKVTSRQNGPVDFALSIPGKITRHYQGTLELRPASNSLVAVVTMDLETAVASVVSAESAPEAPLEALKAQAIAARSYLVAGKGRHRDFDFCDTTHCQFLRNPPPGGTPAARAASETRGLVLVYHSEPIATMYTRSCNGRTRTPAEVGIASRSYPYYSVDCRYCREHPTHWERRLSAQDAKQLQAANESLRLEKDRRLGWDAVPSNSFTVRRTGEYVVLQGAGEGHGIGLCQAGAMAMAKQGATFLEILAHYYPNTSLATKDRVAATVH
jgi:stage II sporulation protein D